MSNRSKNAPVVVGLIKFQKANGRNIYDGEARRELIRLCGESGVSISKTALVNGINANVLRRWIYENKRDPVWFNRRRSNERAVKRSIPSGLAVETTAAKPPVPTVMLPIKISKSTELTRSIAVPSPVAPMIEVELAHGRLKLHGADATMLAAVFNLLRAA